MFKRCYICKIIMNSYWYQKEKYLENENRYQNESRYLYKLYLFFKYRCY